MLFFKFLSPYVFSWKSTYTSEDLQLDATGINRKELSPVSRNFDMNWIKYYIYAAWQLQWTVDILELKRFLVCFFLFEIENVI